VCVAKQVERWTPSQSRLYRVSVSNASVDLRQEYNSSISHQAAASS
jgi:hypothetical protein